MHSLSSTLDFLRFAPLSLVQKVRLAATIFYASRIRDWRPLETELVADWLRRWSGDRTFDKIWLPLLRAKLGDCYTRTSAAFIWATIARMYAARRTGLKREMFGYVPGGYARILARFTEVLKDEGVEVKLDAPTRKVERNTSGTVDVAHGTDDQSTFDQVILTVPATMAADLCPGLSVTELDNLRAIEYVGIVCASLLLKKPLTPYYITNITESWVPFTAVVEMSALVDPKEFGGQTLVYLPKYAVPGDPIFSRTDAEIRQEFVGGLGRMHPGFCPEDVLAFRVSRVGRVFALPTLGYSGRLPAIETSVRGIHILNSARIVNGTLNVNEVVRLVDTVLPALLNPADPAGPPHTPRLNPSD
jgi:protoporphyrinogen oxidase